MQAPVFWPLGPLDGTTPVPPSDIVAERFRSFGECLLRLWVEDCPMRGCVRIHVLHPESFARLHADLGDVDLQAMYSAWWSKLARRGGIVSAGGGRRRQQAGAHDAELKSFLLDLLDAVYFEADEEGDGVQLRLPASVEPPKPLPDPALVEVPTRPVSSCSLPDRLLVHRSVVSLPSDGLAELTSTSCRSAPARSPHNSSQDLFTLNLLPCSPPMPRSLRWAPLHRPKSPGRSGPRRPSSAGSVRARPRPRSQETAWLYS